MGSSFVDQNIPLVSKDSQRRELFTVDKHVGLGTTGPRSSTRLWHHCLRGHAQPRKAGARLNLDEEVVGFARDVRLVGLFGNAVLPSSVLDVFELLATTIVEVLDQGLGETVIGDRDWLPHGEGKCSNGLGNGQSIVIVSLEAVHGTTNQARVLAPDGGGGNLPTFSGFPVMLVGLEILLDEPGLRVRALTACILAIIAAHLHRGWVRGVAFVVSVVALGVGATLRLVLAIGASGPVILA